MSVSSFLTIIIAIAGCYMLVKLRFFFVLHPIKCFRVFVSELALRDSRRALCLALAGTLGVGNIFGVAAGLIIGGAGSVFWLMISALFSMVLKYSETALAVDLKSGERGGMPYVTDKVFKKHGKILGWIYAAACLLLAFCMGGAMQSAATAEVFSETFSVFSGGVAISLAFALVISVLKGGDGIEKIASVVVPFACLLYIAISLLALFSNFEKIPIAFERIISEAVSPKAFCGGMLTFFFSRAVSEGFARGMLSNEAGVGTSSMAHSRSDKRSGQVAGLFGICEVFTDTVVLCGLTGFVILSAVEDISIYKTPMSLVSAAFEYSLGKESLVLLSICTAIFAFSTIICWYYYGNECWMYIFRRNGGMIYTFSYVFSIFIGVLTNSFFIISITDFAMLIMAFITLFAVLKYADRISEMTKKLYK